MNRADPGPPKDSRLAKYFMNKLAKSKSIADISQRGLNLTKIATAVPPEDTTTALQSKYASTARNLDSKIYKSSRMGGRGLSKAGSPSGTHTASRPGMHQRSQIALGAENVGDHAT